MNKQQSLDDLLKKAADKIEKELKQFLKSIVSVHPYLCCKFSSKTDCVDGWFFCLMQQHE